MGTGEALFAALVATFLLVCAIAGIWGLYNSCIFFYRERKKQER